MKIFGKISKKRWNVKILRKNLIYTCDDDRSKLTYDIKLQKNTYF